MTYIAMNVLTVPDGGGDVLESRFAARKGSVDKAAGFRSFELLRPLSGTQDYLVVTRWDTQADFEVWTQSQSFAHSHAGASSAGDAAQRPTPAATDSSIWAFEVVTESWPEQTGPE